MGVVFAAFLATLLTIFATPAALAQTKPDKDYLVYVVSENPIGVEAD